MASALTWLAEARRFVEMVRGWKRATLAIAAGGVSTLAFAPTFAWPVMFATFPVLVWLMDGAARSPKPKRDCAWVGWCFGFGYFFAGLLWIGEAFLVEAEVFAWLLPFAVTLLPAGLSLYWAAALAAIERFWPTQGEHSLRDDGVRVLLLASALGLVEWLRGHWLTGFPWNTPGIALTGPLTLMQAVGVLGIYGLTLWAVFIFSLPLVVASRGVHRGWWQATGGAALALLPLSGAYLYGTWQLSLPPPAPLPGVKVRLVQPSIPQRDKWDASKQPEIFSQHLSLSRGGDGERSLEGISHVIWPEAAMPFGPLDHPEALAAIAAILPPQTLLLAGALRLERDQSTNERRAYNSLLALDSKGEMVGLYDKVHLVPFGEYLPFQASLEAIGLQSLTRQRGGFTPGPLPKPRLDVPGLGTLATLICYEAIFPGEVHPGGARPDVILIVTNDGWFGNSTGPYQHWHQARLRAVEQGTPVIRSANNGISGVIDPYGRILGLLPMNSRATLDGVIPQRRGETVYAVSGDVIFWFNLIVFAIAARLFKVCHIMLKVQEYTSLRSRKASVDAIPGCT